MKYSDLFRTAAVVALSIAMAVVPAVAKNGNPKVKPAVAKPTSAGPKAKATTPKAQAPKAAKAQVPKAKAKAPTAANAAGPTKSSRSASTKGSKANRNTDATAATNVADATPLQPTLSKAQQKLIDNRELASRLRLRLGSDPMAAAAGFKNLGQFVAAVNVSNNLGIPFLQLKSLMVDRGMSLGQAIQQAKTLQVSAATSVANAAIVQAEDEIAATSVATAPAPRKVKDKS